MVPAAASLPPFQLPRASESPVTFHCIGRSSLPPFQLPRASESSVTFHCIGRSSLPPSQLPRASESPVTFHCIGRSSLFPSQLPRASESPVTFHCIDRSVTFRKVHTSQALSSHTIRIREEGYRFFTPPVHDKILQYFTTRPRTQRPHCDPPCDPHTPPGPIEGGRDPQPPGLTPLDSNEKEAFSRRNELPRGV